MDLKMRDVTKMLRISEQTLREMIETGRIPSYQLGNQIRFAPEELEEWLIRSTLSDPLLGLDKQEDLPSLGVHQYALFRALHKGRVLPAIASDHVVDLFSQVTDLIASDLHMAPEKLCDVLLERQEMMSTAVNAGLAIPHSRQVSPPKGQSVIYLVYMQEPIEFGALDKQKVHTLFFLFAQDPKDHLNLLAKVAHLAAQPHMVELLQSRPEKRQLLEKVQQFETRL